MLKFEYSDLKDYMQSYGAQAQGHKANLGITSDQVHLLTETLMLKIDPLLVYANKKNDVHYAIKMLDLLININNDHTDTVSREAFDNAISNLTTAVRTRMGMNPSNSYPPPNIKRTKLTDGELAILRGGLQLKKPLGECLEFCLGRFNLPGDKIRLDLLKGIKLAPGIHSLSKLSKQDVHFVIGDFLQHLKDRCQRFLQEQKVQTPASGVPVKEVAPVSAPVLEDPQTPTPIFWV